MLTSDIRSALSDVAHSNPLKLIPELTGNNAFDVFDSLMGFGVDPVALAMGLAVGLKLAENN